MNNPHNVPKTPEEIEARQITINALADIAAGNKQLKKWREGISIHIRVDGQQCCCPDYSCCNPILLAPKPIRELYVKAKLENKHIIKEKLNRTFTKYFADIQGYQSNAINVMSYSDWLETNHFGTINKFRIKRWMKKRGIKD